jgi:hypothetical protein
MLRTLGKERGIDVSATTHNPALANATIKDAAEHYAAMGCQVEILTGDQGLKAYEPPVPPEVPRRRSSTRSTATEL